MANDVITITIQADDQSSATFQKLVSNLQQTGSAADKSGESTTGFMGKIASMKDGIETAALSLLGGKAAFDMLREATTRVYDVLVKGTIEFANQVTELSHHAEALGLSVQTMDQLNQASYLLTGQTDTLSGVMQRLERNLGMAAATGKGPAADALRDLGLDFNYLLSLPVDEQLRLIVQQLGALESPTQRAHDAQALFGRSWQELIPLMSDGGKGLDNALAKADAYGRKLSTETVQASRALTESTRELGLAWDALTSRSTIWIDALTGIERALTGVLTQLRAIKDNKLSPIDISYLSGGVPLDLGTGSASNSYLVDQEQQLGDLYAQVRTQLNTTFNAQVTAVQAQADQAAQATNDAAARALAVNLANDQLAQWASKDAQAQADQAAQTTADTAARALATSLANDQLKRWADATQQGADTEADLTFNTVQAISAEEMLRHQIEITGDGLATLGDRSGSLGDSMDTADRLILHGLIPSLSTAKAGFDAFTKEFAKGEANPSGSDFSSTFNILAYNLSDMIGKTISASMLAGGIGAALTLLFQNPEMQALVKQLDAALQALITPLVDGIAPALTALTPVFQAMEPELKILGAALKTELQPVVIQLQLVDGALGELNKLIKPLNDSITAMGAGVLKTISDGLSALVHPLKDLVDAIKHLIPGSGGFDPSSILPSKLFAEGGTVTPDRMLDYNPTTGAGMIVAHAGETVVPKGGAGGSPVFNIAITAMNAADVKTQLRSLLEELALTGKLGVA